MQHVRRCRWLFKGGWHVSDINCGDTLIDNAAFQLGLWCHHVHPPGRLPAVLASQANDNAAQHHGGEVQLHVPRMVGYFRWVPRRFRRSASMTSRFVLLEDPKDLIRKCLVVDPEKRINVRECLKHPFFNTVVSSGSCAGSERASVAQTRHLFYPPTRFPEHFTQTIFRLIKLLVLWQPRKPHEQTIPLSNCFEWISNTSSMSGTSKIFKD